MKKSTLVLSLFTFLFSTLSSFSVVARTPLNKTTKEKVIKALDLNDELHMAFFEYDGKKVQEKGQSLKKALLKIKEPKLKKLFTGPLKTLDKIKAKASRAENNESFHEVSKAFVYIVNTYDVGEGYNEYTCPMVKKKWVQNSKKRARTHNPYAPEMPHCGGQVTDY